MRPFREYAEGLRYMRQQPLMLAIALLGVGWASGGGAAQILFSLFGEFVFNRGPAGIGIVWGCAGCGLIVGGAVAHRLGPRLSFNALQAHGRDLLPRARRRVRPVQPVDSVSVGAVLDRPLARGGGGELRAELCRCCCATSATSSADGCSRPTSRWYGRR